MLLRLLLAAVLCGNLFEGVPEWALAEVPGARGIWAPDISHFSGRYHLYYSVSTSSTTPTTARPAGRRYGSPRSPGSVAGPPYSLRKASTGSTRVARRAGR
jgi:hypothetical protein